MKNQIRRLLLAFALVIGGATTALTASTATEVVQDSAPVAEAYVYCSYTKNTYSGHVSCQPQQFVWRAKGVCTSLYTSYPVYGNLVANGVKGKSYVSGCGYYGTKLTALTWIWY